MDELKQLYDRDSEIYDAIEQAFQSLAREGLIVDSGRREWNELTGSYEIVWVKNLN
jgi:hypothetical protein